MSDQEYKQILYEKDKDVPHILYITLNRPEKNNAVSIGAILEHLRSAVDIEIDVRQDPGRLRKIDPSVLRGDASRARDELGWQPRHSLEDALDSVLDFWRQQTAEEK